VATPFLVYTYSQNDTINVFRYRIAKKGIVCFIYHVMHNFQGNLNMVFILYNHSLLQINLQKTERDACLKIFLFAYVIFAPPTMKNM